MLLVFTTFLLLLAGISLAMLLKKLADQNLIEEHRPASLAAENYRPLFAPTDEELKKVGTEENEQLAAKRAEEERLSLEQKLAEVEKFRVAWSMSPNQATTMELLHRASQTGKGETYLAVCEHVLAARRDGRLAEIAADDLAQLLESHMWLLPADERTPGITFRLKDDIADLRRDASLTTDRIRKS